LQIAGALSAMNSPLFLRIVLRGQLSGKFLHFGGGAGSLLGR